VALYAAYGSNMDPAQMLARCPHSPQRGTGWLEGWRLTFGGEDIGWDGALTTVAEDPAQRVFVVLYDVPEVDEKELDTWDGVTLGYYRKLKVRVQSLDGDALAWLYVLDAYEGGLPSARHISILVDSAIKAGAPDDYIQWLRARPSNPPATPSGSQPVIADIPDEPLLVSALWGVQTNPQTPRQRSFRPYIRPRRRDPRKPLGPRAADRIARSSARRLAPPREHRGSQPSPGYKPARRPRSGYSGPGQRAARMSTRTGLSAERNGVPSAR
jgi:hypothetical protein